MMYLEIIGFTLDGCRQAEDAGAMRIELCDNPHEGGTTPSHGFIKEARRLLSIPLFPIIRPRGGDFLYDDNEFEAMKADVLQAKNLGCDGVVIGFLNADGSIDKVRTKQLVSLAYPMDVTFHRAFDRVADLAKSLEDVIDCGCTRILTSGGFPGVEAGEENLKMLVQLSAERIIIMPGSGVKSDNLEALIKNTGAREFHSSARKLQTGKMIFNRKEMDEEAQHYGVDVEEVKKLRSIINACTVYES